jgi:hypothetical protein
MARKTITAVVDHGIEPAISNGLISTQVRQKRDLVTAQNGSVSDANITGTELPMVQTSVRQLIERARAA